MVIGKFTKILIALLLLLCALFIVRASMQSSLDETAERFQAVEAAVRSITRLRLEWEGGGASRSSVSNLFASESYKKLGVFVQTPQGIKAEFKGMNAQTFAYLMRQIFESRTIVKAMRVDRRGDEAVDLTLEIVW
ncbi:MAG: hypothetical protein LBE89_00260 [Helicobacteraceae bacterium]|jgi:hypothetical protein|nr:hypothetical protein [Helicobacteraceae bacterium]